jgi:dTDP-4-dehydrorhamnose 3,5-epimerase-like enzyme
MKFTELALKGAYLIELGEFFQPDFYAGLWYNDPKLNIVWKNLGSEPIMNERDKNYPLL